MNKKTFLKDYVIYKDGRVWSNLTNKFLKQSTDRYGYNYVQLKKKKYKVHRLVAMSFIPNPNNKQQVNHIDGNKQNNNISNLEWCTPKENIKHARENGLIKKQKKGKENHLTKKVYVFDKTGKLIDTVFGHKEACKKYATAKGTIVDQLSKKEFNINRIKTKNLFSYYENIVISTRSIVKSIKTVYVYNKDGEIIDTIQGANEASKKYNIAASTIKYQCKLQKRNVKKELFFSYRNDLK